MIGIRRLSGWLEGRCIGGGEVGRVVGLGLGNRVTTLMLDDWSSSRLRLYDLILIDNHNTPELLFLPFLEKFTTYVARITRHAYVNVFSSH